MYMQLQEGCRLVQDQGIKIFLIKSHVYNESFTVLENFIGTDKIVGHQKLENRMSSKFC